VLKKPTGEVGPTRFLRSEEGGDISWNTVSFPHSKDEIEFLMARMFHDALIREGVRDFTYRQNEENDFDFTLEFAHGSSYLELCEIFYRDVEGSNAGQPPYKSRRTAIKDFAYAMQIAAAVYTKSNRYRQEGKTPIDLLLYVTHWRFSPSELTVRLVQHFLLSAPPIFDHVFFIKPVSDSEGDPRVLFPSHDPLEGHVPEEFVDGEYLKLDPRRWRVVSG